jgi:hypothetical protein
VYIGSSYGKLGIQNRIKDHLSQLYRENDTSKAFYIAMEKPGAATSFILLASYPTTTPVAQVLLTEAVCCSIFGTLKSKIHLRLRLKELPKVNWEYGLNRSDPLQSMRFGLTTIGNDITTYRRLRTLNNCLKSGPVHVGFHPRRRSSKNGSYQFSLFDESFAIPRDIADTWGLDNHSEVNVQWEIVNDTHPQAFAPMAKNTDDGRRVGIRVFKTIGGVVRNHWVVRQTPGAVTIANTLHDFLTGQIVGKDYIWNNTRKYIFQKSKHYANRATKNVNSSLAQKVRRKRVGIPYYNEEFI